jgi:excinuclease ABC subunit C
VNKKLEKKLAEIPKDPGVYLYKDSAGEIIYIGKAAILKNRVKQYFQKSRTPDAKTDALVAEIADVEWITIESEIDALFLEAELVRRYLPRYNILLRDDKSNVYVRIDSKSAHPTVTVTRRPLDDGAEYFGPYFAAWTVRKALSYLRRAFPYSTHVRNIPKRACLQYQIGLCPGLEEGKTSLPDYRKNLIKLKKYLKGERKQLVRQIEKEMQEASKKKQFEQAARARNQLHALQGLSKQIVFSDREFLDISKDQALAGLAQLLGLRKTPFRIEGFDISHMGGVDTVASMVVFTNGVPNKTEYRKFKMRIPGNDDFAHMNEVIKRRFSESNLKKWPKPDLVLIDGGKGQLDAALKARAVRAVQSVPMIGLAKREEEIIVARNDEAVNLKPDGLTKETERFTSVLLPRTSNLVKLLQRIRDESHRFAVSYHTVLKRQRQTQNILEEIPGVGGATRKKLLRKFGSVKQISLANVEEISVVVGQSKAKLVYSILHEESV